MRKSGQVLLFLLLALGLLSLGSCGGGSTSSLGSAFDLPGTNSGGVTSGDFKAIRFNDRGFADPALNPTLELQVAQDGASTTVTLHIADQDPMLGAAVDLFYDPARYSPVTSEFSGLVADSLELASTRRSGVVSVGQVATTGVNLRSGEFATITFAHSPLRLASAVGDAHSSPVNRGYTPTQAGAPNVPSGLVVTKAAIDATDAAYTVYSFFAVGDGNADGATTLGDLSAMVFNGYFGTANVVSAADWGTMPTDYNGDGETGVADLTALGQRLGEATTAIDVLIKDNDANDFTGAETVAATHAWTSGADPARPPANDTVSVDALMRNWSGTIDQATATAADGNGDGIVLISAIATSTGASSPVFTDDTLEITFPVGVPGVTVTGFDGNIAAATPQPFDDTTTDITLVAGEAISLEITGISGTFDPGGGNPLENFDGAPSASMLQQSYDDSLAQVRSSAAWTVGMTGAADFRTTVPVLDLAATTGSPVAGTVTPDDDPDSNPGTTPEGTLVLNVPISGTFIPLPLGASMTVDVEANVAAPVMTDVTTDQPLVGSFKGLNSAGSTTITVRADPGTAALPGDLSTTSLSLVPAYAAGDTIGSANAIDLTYTAGVPASGEFAVTLLIAPPDPDVIAISAVVPASAVPGVVYAMQFSFADGTDTVMTSVNNPGDGFCTIAPPPPAVEFATIPGNDVLLGKNDALLITYPEPVLRRDQRVVVADGNVTPTDAAGYGDIVKSTGDSFALVSQARSGGGGFDEFPDVIVVLGTDPSTITSTSAREPLPVVFRGPSSLVLDISNATFQGTADVDYAFKVFGAAAAQANWPNLGTGTFTYSPTGIAPGGPVAVDFGINIFDDAARGDLDLAGRDFSGKTLNGSTITTAQSDVLYVEAGNFGFFDFDGLDPFDYSAPLSGANTRLRFTDVLDGSQTMTVGLVPCAGNLATAGNIIAMLEFTNEHFSRIGFPGWPGILTPGSTYSLTLVDPQAPGSDADFTGTMIVTGANPN